MRRQHGCTSVMDVMEYKRTKSQNFNNNQIQPLTDREPGKEELLDARDNIKRVREIVERSKQNERRGRKQRNLFAVGVYNRRNCERRDNIDQTAS